MFTVQKQIGRIMVSAQPRAPCRGVFKELEVLPFDSISLNKLSK